MKFEFISFSADIPDFHLNGIFNYSIASQYPGALWMYECKQRCATNVLFLSSDVALEQVKHQKINPHKILVVQHGLDPDSSELINQGAYPFLLTMFESPLYAGDYYNKLPSLSNKFDYLLSYLVDGVEPHKVIPIHFPSFSIEAGSKNNNKISMAERRFACIVVSNKFVLLNFSTHLTSITSFFWLVAKYLKQKFSGYVPCNVIDLSKVELQTKRIEVMTAFSKRNMLDLFGRGWDKLYRLPPQLRNLVRKSISIKNVKPIKDKIATLGNYKFNLCIENVSHPGYVTEKIIEAFVAGTVPVYWGAPDIERIIPADTYINANKFNTNDDLIDYLESIDEDVWLKKLEAGRNFLTSEVGAKYSYESVAVEVCERLKRVA